MSSYQKVVLERENLLADAYALSYLHSREIRDLLPLILFKVKIHVSILSVHEFLSYIFYKLHDSTLISQITELLFKLYVVERLEKDTIVHSAMILSDLLRHGVTPDIVDLFNVALAISKNMVILTSDPGIYTAFSKYGIAIISIDEFIKEFRSELAKM